MTEDNIKKVIVRFPNWLGDCIMALPFLEALHRACPKWELTVLVRGYLHQLFEHDPRVHKVIELKDKFFHPSKLFNVAEDLNDNDYDIGIILPDSFSSALIFSMAQIPRRIGFKAEMRSFMLTDSISMPKQIIHRSMKYLQLMDMLDINPDEDLKPKIYSDESSRRGAERLIEGLGSYIVVTPQTNAPSRRWGYDKYSRLISRVVNELKTDVVLLGAAGESEIVEKVGENSGVKCLNLAGKTSLLVSYEILKRSLCFLGNDSGAAHLAAASGTYTISISGADNPEETHPLAERGKIIRSDLPCLSCVKNICPRKDFPMECMHVIKADQVLEAVKGAIDE
jgi:heptosyltransferase-2